MEVKPYIIVLITFFVSISYSCNFDTCSDSDTRVIWTSTGHIVITTAKKVPVCVHWLCDGGVGNDASGYAHLNAGESCSRSLGCKDACCISVRNMTTKYRYNVCQNSGC